MNTVLVVDVGNTNTKLAIYQGDSPVYSCRIATVPDRTEQDLTDLIKSWFQSTRFDPRWLDGAVVSSVVPPLTPVLESVLKKEFECSPLIVGPDIKTGLSITYENLKELGADRIAVAVGGVHLYGPPLIIVSLGTATTFSVIDEGGQFLGGVILPGLAISAQALFQKTSLLPQFELNRPQRVVGCNTLENMQSGVVFGGIGQVDAVVRRIKEEIPQEFKVVATGGFSQLLAPYSATFQYCNPNLLLEGLRVLWQMNRA